MKGKGAIISLALGNIFARVVPVVAAAVAIMMAWTLDELINDVLPALLYFFGLPLFFGAMMITAFVDAIRWHHEEVLEDVRRRKSYRWEPGDIRAAKAYATNKVRREAERCRRRRAKQLAFRALRHILGFRLFEPICKAFETAIWLGTAIVAVGCHILLCLSYGPAMWLLAPFVLVCLVVMCCWVMIHNAWEVDFHHLTKHQRHARDLATMSARGTADVLLWYLRPWTRPTMQ